MNFPNIRPMQVEDLSRVAELAFELGYPTLLSELQLRYQDLITLPEQTLVVYHQSKTIIGWTHLRIERTLLSDKKVEICALVVDEKYRGQGVGKQFVEFSKYWAKINGSNTISVRTSILRERAHAFYQREGFELRKTSHVFTLQN